MFRAVLIAVFVLVAVSTYSEDAAEMQQKGIAALKESQTNPRAIVDAARSFARASAAYEGDGDTDKAVEMNSYLYWCKKKMSLQDIEEFIKGGETSVTQKLNAVEQLETNANDAKAWLDRAERFARANPNEHLLIAIRFFEVAGRFKGSDESLSAMDRSLKEMQVVGEKPVLPPVRLNVEANAPLADGKQPIPAAASVKQTEKTLRETFKNEYAGTKPEERAELFRKLMAVAADSPAGSADKYVALREARDIAVAQGEVSPAFEALDALAQVYSMDKAAEAAAMLQKFQSAQAEEATYLACKIALRLIDETAKAEKFEALKPLISAAGSLVGRLPNRAYVAELKARLSKANEIVKEWPACKSAMLKLKDSPDDEAANHAMGRFYCFILDDWERGLPALARGPDKALKAAAEKEAARPQLDRDQAAVGDAWFEISKKSGAPVHKAALEARALFWYRKALAVSSGLEKLRIEKRMAEVPAANVPVSIPKIVIVSAKYGAGDKVLDVTAKLKKNFENDPFAILCSSAYGLGDPVPGKVKDMHAEIQVDGRTIKVAIPDHGVYVPPWFQTGVEVPNQQFKVLNAKAYEWKDCVDATEGVAKQVSSGDSAVKISSPWKTDPAPGAQKYLAIWFESGGKRYLRRYKEGDAVIVRP